MNQSSRSVYVGLDVHKDSVAVGALPSHLKCRNQVRAELSTGATSRERRTIFRHGRRLALTGRGLIRVRRR
jgi:hypothetical protein